MQIWSRFPDCCSCSQSAKCYQDIASVRVKHCATSFSGVGSAEDRWQHERAQAATSSRVIVLTVADAAVSISAWFPFKRERDRTTSSCLGFCEKFSRASDRKGKPPASQRV